MQLTTKLIQILPIQSGNSKNGEWKKQDIIVETQDQYPKKICISLWGDKFSSINLKEGETYTIDFDVESREYNGKWYTDVKAWKIEPKFEVSTISQSQSTNTEKTESDIFDDEDDDLPF